MGLACLTFLALIPSSGRFQFLAIQKYKWQVEIDLFCQKQTGDVFLFRALCGSDFILFS